MLLIRDLIRVHLLHICFLESLLLDWITCCGVFVVESLFHGFRSGITIFLNHYLLCVESKLVFWKGVWITFFLGENWITISKRRLEDHCFECWRSLFEGVIESLCCWITISRCCWITVFHRGMEIESLFLLLNHCFQNDSFDCRSLFTQHTIMFTLLVHLAMFRFRKDMHFVVL